MRSVPWTASVGFLRKTFNPYLLSSTLGLDSTSVISRSVVNVVEQHALLAELDIATTLNHKLLWLLEN